MGRSAVFGRGLAWLARRRVLSGVLAGALLGVVILVVLIGLSPKPVEMSPEELALAMKTSSSTQQTAPKPAPPVESGFTDPVPRMVLEHGKATPLNTNTLHDWRYDDRSPTTYRVGGVTLTWANSEMGTYNGHPDPYGLMLKISAPGLKTRTLNLSSVSGTEFSVGRIDPARPGPQVVFTENSGGRGCCINYYLLTPGKGIWRLERLGRWNFSNNEGRLRDRDGDGAPEFELLDESFFPYPRADIVQMPPPRFIQVQAGKAVDVSHKPAFARYFRDHVRLTLPECRKHNNFACASFVAAAARIGRKDWAWAIAMKNYDREAGNSFWYYCGPYEVKEACDAPETIFPIALRETLIRDNYWPGTIGKRDATS